MTKVVMWNLILTPLDGAAVMTGAELLDDVAAHLLEAARGARGT